MLDEEYWIHLKNLEDALIEYVERYGPTARAREALTASEKLRSRRRNEGPVNSIRGDEN